MNPGPRPLPRDESVEAGVGACNRDVETLAGELDRGNGNRSTVGGSLEIAGREGRTARDVPVVRIETPTSAPVSRPSSRFERGLLKRILTSLGAPAIEILLWDGQAVAADGVAPVARFTIRERRTLWKLLWDPFFQFGEEYSAGRIEIDGDLLKFLTTIYNGQKQSNGPTSRPGLLERWRNRPHRNTLAGSRNNIHRHYDLGNDFYRLWLDDEMLYTCAYFPRAGMTLEQAQVAKMDHVCRKLWLGEGQTVVEAGCGWGGLARHMARHYGVTVRAFNISREQIDYARRRAQHEGLADRVEFVHDDWRNITGRYDVFVSVGMLEHVGRDNYRQLGDVIHQTLKADGRCLIHSIGQNYARPFDRWIEQRVFPGAYPPALREMADIFEHRDFSVLDVENLRLHYAETLWHWWQRFERSIDTVRMMFGERFVRMWRLYLAGSAASFESGNLQLFQVLFARGLFNDIPRSRLYQYAQDQSRFDRLAPDPRLGGC